MSDGLAIKKQAKLLIDRLERLSADSLWAHRASGLRRSLIRAYDKGQFDNSESNKHLLERLIRQGYKILTDAASGIPGDDR